MNDIKFVGLHAHGGVGSPFDGLGTHKSTWSLPTVTAAKLWP